MPYVNKFCKNWNAEIAHRAVSVSEIVDGLKMTDYFGIATATGFIFLSTKQNFIRDINLLESVFNQQNCLVRTAEDTPDPPTPILLRSVSEVYMRKFPFEPEVYILKTEGDEIGLQLFADEYDIYILHCYIRNQKHRPLTLSLDYDAVRNAKPIWQRTRHGDTMVYNVKGYSRSVREILSYMESHNYSTALPPKEYR